MKPNSPLDQSAAKKPKKTSLIGNLILVAILLGIVVFAGYYYFIPAEKENKNTNQVVVNAHVNQNNSLNQNINDDQNGNENTSVAVNSNTNTAVDETADWQTYTNDEYNFTLKYPVDWTYKEYSLTAEESFIMNIPIKFVIFYSPEENYLFTFGIKKENEDIGIQGYTGIGGDIVAGEEVKIGEVTVKAGEIVYQNKTTNVFFPNTPGEGKVAEINGHIIQSDLRCSNDMYIDNECNLKDSNEYEVVKTILSTFQFTDATAGWETYENNTWGFSFKYPEEWNEISDKLPTSRRESGVDEPLIINSNEKTEDDVSYPRLVLYVNPAGWGTCTVHKMFTVSRDTEGKYLIEEEKETGAQAGEFCLSDYYSIRIAEQDYLAPDELYITLTSTQEGTSSDTFDELTRDIISTFQFTD